jgi:hypothetical protein
MGLKNFVVQSRRRAADGTLAPLGARRDIEAALASRNTHSDHPGGDRLYGPGIDIDIAPDEDPVLQMLLTINDEDIAWDVIVRLSREFQWKIIDPNSGRELSP